MIRLQIVILICFVFLLNGCVLRDDVKEGAIREGVIEYKITYLENHMSKNIPTNLLPSKMILRFKNDRTVLSIEGFMGLFSIVVINDHKKQVSTSLLNVIGKKYYYVSDPGEESFCFKPISGMVVEHRKGGKEISGMKAQRGRVIFPETTLEPFIFYFTDDIQIRSPNYDNPYSNIDGVLLQFQIRLNKLRMEVEAATIKEAQIDNSVFNVPPGYRKVSKNDMEEILNTLME